MRNGLVVRAIKERFRRIKRVLVRARAGAWVQSSARGFSRLKILLHTTFIIKPHAFLLGRFGWYRKWCAGKSELRAHSLLLSTYGIVLAGALLGIYRGALALPDLFDNWDFSTPSSYTIDSGVETSGSIARLKAQNYTSDANTRALYHLDESVGNASDSSPNNNTATVNGTTNWVTGNLNNAFSFASTYLRAPDSASLSFTQSNTLEAWTKFNSAFSATSHSNKQGILDKGAYKLYYDQESGKVTYEIANSSGNTWDQQAGNDIKDSWDVNGKLSVNSQTTVGNDVYVGLGNVAGDAEVWRWSGGVWTQIGGDAKNDSWADGTFETVLAMASNGTMIYAGLGTTAGDGEVWQCNTSTNCTDWDRIGGDGINSGWAVNIIEQVNTMTVMGGNLYVGLGATTTTDARVWRWNGTTWTWVGGNGIGSPYNVTAWPAGYESVMTLTNDGTNLYAGLGTTAGDGDVWRLTGTTWTQIGGDGTGWAASTYDSVLSLRFFNGSLYAGLGVTAGEAEVWRYTSGTWTQIGGDALNSSWDGTNYEGVYSFTDDGTNLYAGLGNGAGDNEVYRWNGTTWTKIGGDGVGSGFTTPHTIVDTLSFTNGTLYAGITTTGINNSEMWSWNGTAWTRIGGGFANNSWGYSGLQNVESMTVSGNYLYAGTGNATAGNAMVFRFDGNSWLAIGGQGLNGSWPYGTYEDISSMVSFGGNLYVGLGATAGDGEVWVYNGSTWTKIGGDGANSSWNGTYEDVSSMAAFGGNLYVGLGNNGAGDAEVWRWSAGTWTKIGGDAVTSWNTGYDRVASLAVYNGQLYAGLGITAGEAEVYRYTSGVNWTKVGGDTLNSGWDGTNYENVESMTVYNGKLYAGLGLSTGDAELWEWNGTAWTRIGGDGINSGWADGQYEQVKSMVVYNGRLYVGLANSATDAEVWEYDGSAWDKVGGGGTNSSWTVGANIESVRSFSVYKGKLYAGLGDTQNADAQIWSFGNNGFLQSSTVGQDTNWHHIAASYDGTTMKLFIDGVQDSTTAVTQTIPDTTEALLIGSTYGTSETGLTQGYFDGLIDEVRISDIARSTLTTKPYATTPQTITLSNAVRSSGVWHWDDFITSETTNGGTVNYRLSDNGGTNWKYWNGSGWVASASTSQANPVATIDTNIATFPVTFQGITWQAVLSGNGNQRVTLNTVTLQSTSDTTVPSAAPVSISALKASGGSSLASNAWTNGGSPYFSWTAGSDSESGIKGYCAYVGTDNSADPATTKGLLGSSPVSTGGFCQYVVSGTNLDLGSPGALATALTSSNSPYYVILKVIDNAGNVSAGSASFHFRFDNTPPTNPGFITAPSGFVNSKDVTLTWPTAGGNAPSDANSGLIGLQYRISPSGTWYGDSHTGAGDINDLLTNDGSYTTVDPPDFDDLQEGTNTVYFRTWDQAGNVTTSYVTAAIKINTAGAPSEPQNVIATPSTNTTNAFAFSWDEPVTFVGNADNITYCYTINTAPSASTCTFTTAGVTSLGSGPYATQPGANTFYVVARDESSNINYASYTTVTFTANTTAPGIPLNMDIVDVSIKSTNNWRLAITWEPPTFTGAGVASYKIFRSTDNVSFSQVGTSSSTTYIDAGLTQQRYYYKVSACDSTNNCGAQTTSVSEIPTGKFTTAATLVSNPEVSDITTRRATITWSTDRASDSKIAIGTSSGSYSPSEVGNSAQVTAHSLSLDNLSAGTTYYLVAKWTDEDGNTGTSSEFVFSTLPPPTLKEINTVFISLTSAKVQFTSKSANKVSLLYGKNEGFGGIITLNTSTTESTYTVDIPDLEDGTKYFFKLVSYDSENNAYEGSVFSFTTPPRPRITNLRFQPVAGEPTSTQRVTWQTNVPSTSSITYGKVGSNGNEAVDPKLVTDHEITIRDLEDDSEYFLVANSRDGDGNLATSDRQVFRTALDTRPPKISGINIESSIRGTGAEARGQVIVSWRTDELSTSQVAFAEGSGATNFNNRTAEDAALSFEHIVIVSDLPTSKVYSIQPVSKDKSGNSGKGQTQSAIIGRATDNVLTIVLNSLKKVFGF